MNIDEATRIPDGLLVYAGYTSSIDGGVVDAVGYDVRVGVKIRTLSLMTSWQRQSLISTRIRLGRAMRAWK